MQANKVVSHEEWIEARKKFLDKEKEFTRLRDKLTQERQSLPWERVDKNYIFDGANGKESLSDLFNGRSQLIVYHFMYGVDWKEGCKSCSFLADHFNPTIIHLNNRDVTLVAVSTAPLPILETFKKRMGWNFKWVSSFGTEFNHDYYVTFTQEENNSGTVYYNYRKKGFSGNEAPGASVFYKDTNGDIFHTYSVYQRGLDMFLTAYHYLDIAPKGRDEDKLSYGMEWLRLHDDYDH